MMEEKSICQRLIDELEESNQAKYREQAKFLRESVGITDINKAIEFMKAWLPSQKFTSGVMAGELATVMLTCAILGEAIEPKDDRNIAMAKATVGWDVYWGLKEQGLW